MLKGLRRAVSTEKDSDSGEEGTALGRPPQGAHVSGICLAAPRPTPLARRLQQVVIDADSRPFVSIGRPGPGNRNDCKAWELSGAKSSGPGQIVTGP